MVSQALRRRDTRQKILLAAATLFGKQGFENTSVAEIVRDADVVKGTFYQHFATKTDLLLALGREQGTDRVRQLLTSVAAGASALEALSRYYSVLAQWFESQAPIALDVIISAIRLHDPHSNQPEIFAHDFTKAILLAAQQQGEIRSDINANALAIAISGAFTMAVIDWCKEPLPGHLSALFKECFGVFLEGALTVNQGKRHHSVPTDREI